MLKHAVVIIPERQLTPSFLLVPVVQPRVVNVVTERRDHGRV
jgi:hypothetical protein